MVQRRGIADVQDAIIEDLRDYIPLTDWLDDPTDVAEGWPNEADDDTGLQVMVQTVWGGSRTRGPRAKRRTARVQCAVVATPEWWQTPSRPNPATDMYEALDRCADRLDVACGTTLPGVFLMDGGGMGAATGMTEEGDNRRVAHADWRFGWTQVAQPDN